MREVEHRQVADRLRVESVARIDRRPAAEQAGRERPGELRAVGERIEMNQPEQCGQVGEEDGGRDHCQRPGIPSPPCRPPDDPRPHSGRVGSAALSAGWLSATFLWRCVKNAGGLFRPALDQLVGDRAEPVPGGTGDQARVAGIQPEPFRIVDHAVRGRAGPASSTVRPRSGPWEMTFWPGSGCS